MRPECQCREHVHFAQKLLIEARSRDRMARVPTRGDGKNQEIEFFESDPAGPRREADQRQQGGNHHQPRGGIPPEHKAAGGECRVIAHGPSG
jgi:hypothetical protein